MYLYLPLSMLDSPVARGHHPRAFLKEQERSRLQLIGLPRMRFGFSCNYFSCRATFAWGQDLVILTRFNRWDVTGRLSFHQQSAVSLEPQLYPGLV